MELFKNSKLFYWTAELVLVIVGVYFLWQMPAVFLPVFKMVGAVLLPLFVAGFLYYMFDPVVNFLQKRGLSRVWGFLLSFFVVVIIIILAAMNVIPQLIEQTIQLTQQLPTYADELVKWLDELAKQDEFKNFNLEQQLDSANITINRIINFVIVNVTSSLSSIFSVLTKFFVLLFTVPFILLFMFKDGHRFLDALSNFFPRTIRRELRQTVRELNDTLSAYISSTVLDAFIIGIMSFIAMTIFNQPYSLLLALICGITNIIPYVGPFIGAVPAVIVGMFISPWQALYMALSILVIQQLDGNVIKPLLFGKSLNVHPITIILVLLGAGRVSGIMGMLICIPVYAVIKTLIINIRKIYLLKKTEALATNLEETEE
ncbi:AI-2E family transporter [Enterococcus saigonensis]|uniref:AI-2E family transporter n=1 Tax=Enterococcus saigonensis TaxID=1805431 RepID=A0A679IJM0_9ENTE|nr:AI-2E family transporter [Enterococcus saigonensis]BCA85705.1 AI-2E family transporter [Enterococcus saigonensis]